MSDEKQKKDPSERLKEMVKFDPSKPTGLSEELFAEVLEDVTKERIEEAKTEAKGLLEKALKLREDFGKAKKDFARQEKKFNKELGKLLNKVEAKLRGEAPKDESDDDSSEEDSSE